VFSCKQRTKAKQTDDTMRAKIVEAVQIGERTRGIAIISLADCQSRDLSKVPNQTSNDRSMRRASQ
jgi:hypothetical protein